MNERSLLLVLVPAREGQSLPSRFRASTFGLLDGEVVVLVHIDRADDMHVISLRKAEKYEARYYLETAEDYIRKGH
jgi:uncharacterized DUF497 family protein